jgi:hypothetical protein
MAIAIVFIISSIISSFYAALAIMFDFAKEAFNKNLSSVWC